MKRFLQLTIAIMFLSGIVFAQQTKSNQAKQNPNSKSAQEVLKLEKEMYEALIRPDTPFFERILAEDYAEARVSGGMIDKARLIQILKSGRLKVLAYDINEVRVRIYGKTALATGRYSRNELINGLDGKETEYNQQGRFVDVWEKRNGNWQRVYNQDTNIE
ncbi:MAG: nuclear transport factor 2 family protein [Pyrinomonadaceae bacterium]